MRVLVVNGYGLDEPAAMVDRVVEQLTGHGHDVDRLDLARAGFDEFMTAAERTAYHTDNPLIAPEAAAAAELVQAATGIVIAYPIVHSTSPPRVKSFIERVFVLGVGFEFLPSGRITGALDHLNRALVIGADQLQHVGARHQATRGVAVRGWRRLPHGVPGTNVRGWGEFGPCLARSFYLSSNRSCRARYLTVSDGRWGKLEAELSRW